MSFKTVQKQLQGEGHSKESAGKILGAAAQKAKHPSPQQRKVLRAQGSKRKKTPTRKSGSKAPVKKTAAKSAPPWMSKKAD
jgi:hypothetical protein